MKKHDDIKKRFMKGKKVAADPLAKQKNAFIGKMMKSKKLPC